MRGILSGDLVIGGLGNLTVGDFWSWAYSNVRDNTVRAIFAEWLVGALLGVESTGRVEWDAYDLMLEGCKIEVKSAAYVQSWAQRAPSVIRFDIAQKKAWDAESNTMAAVACRSADIYVFALHDDEDFENANPLDVESWRFWVMSCEEIEVVFGTQKTIGLSAVERRGSPADHQTLKSVVETVRALTLV